MILRDLLSLGATVVAADAGDNARLAKEAGAEAVVSRAQDLPKVDGIVIATPTSTHADVIEALLPRRTPMFCEKPLCDDAGRARDLAALAGDRLFVMDKWRYHHGVLELAAIARTEELGAVVGLRTTRAGYGHSHPDTDCVWTLLPHDLAIAKEILGRSLVPHSSVADRVNEELTGMVAVSVADGGPWHVAEIGVRSPVRERTVKLLCRDGVAILENAYADHLIIVANPPRNGGEPRIVRRSIRVEMPLLAELAAFVKYLDGGPPPKSSAQEAAELVATIAELRRLAGI